MNKLIITHFSYMKAHFNSTKSGTLCSFNMGLGVRVAPNHSNLDRMFTNL